MAPHVPPTPRGSADGAGRLLELVRSGRAATRLELARASGLARSTVTDRLDRLLAAGLLQPAGTLATGSGRPPEGFAFNAGAGVVLVADLGASAARFACCDLDAGVLADERLPIDIGGGPEANLALIRERLAAVLRAAGREPAAVRGVAVGLPGPVEVATGRVVRPPIMTGWDGLDVPAALGLPYAGPVVVDNDVNLMAIGEHRSQHGAETDMIVLKAGTGIGAGLIVSGRPCRGRLGSAGDLGHVQAGVSDVQCRCGLRGCVEAHAGGWALVRELRALGRDVEHTADVVALVHARDPDATALVREAGRIVGSALAYAVALLNPGVIVVGGDLAHAQEVLLAGVREAVHARSSPLATRDLRIVASGLGERAGVIGGAHVVLERVFAPQEVDRALAATMGV